MTRSEEAEAFFAAVYQAVQEIPESRVTTYGHVAALIGRRECLDSKKMLCSSLIKGFQKSTAECPR